MGMTLDWIDFSRARLHWILKEGSSAAVFSVESLLDDGQGERWHLCSTVMAGNVYADCMPKLPPYTYTVAASHKRWMMFRDGGAGTWGDDAGQRETRFRELSFSVLEMPGREISGSEVALAVREELPLMGAVAVTGSESVMLRFPVKHINLHPDGQRWQAETGPLLCPSDVVKELFDAEKEQDFPYALCYVFFRQDGSCSALVRTAATTDACSASPVFTLPVQQFGRAALVLPA